MAQRRIIWSPRSEIDLLKIMEFYKKRNGNSLYSRSIYNRIRRALLILKGFPGVGVKTDIPYVRNLILGEFNVFYKTQKNSIEIIAIWDSKQNPENLNL